MDSSEDLIGVGVIGLGAVALRDYLPIITNSSLARSLGFKTIGVCDIDASQLKYVQTLYGGLRAYAEVSELFGDREIELVLILTPIPTHFQLGIEALKAGKHVYFQKTMGVTRTQADQIIDLADRMNLKIAASPGQVLDEPHRIAKTIVESKELGEVLFARAHGSHIGHENQFTFNTDPRWYYSPGAGPVRDVAVYPINTLTSIVGPVKRVMAMGGIVRPTRTWKGSTFDVFTEDSVMITLDFGESRFAQIDSVYGMLATKSPQCEIYLTGGVIQLGGWCDPDVPLLIYDRQGIYGADGQWIQPRYDSYLHPPAAKTHLGVVADFANLIESVRLKTPFVASAKQARHIIEICEAIYTSIKTGKVQTVKKGGGT